jgi:anti-sigma regulatory factor (Ser/Thr protein kinase)
VNDPIGDKKRPRREEVFVLNLPVDMAAIEEGRLALLSYLQPFDLDARLINRVEVVLEELASNVVRHAKDADSLIIEAERTGSAVLLAVEDNGAAFNPLCVPEPPPFASLEDAMLGGQGIPLIRRLSQSVRYERREARNRIVVLIAG